MDRLVDNNLDALRQAGSVRLPPGSAVARHRLLVEALDGASLLQTRAGHTVRLGSTRDPRREAEALVNAAIGPERTADAVAVIGGGTGAVLEVLDGMGFGRILVIEPEAELAFAWLSRRSWLDLIDANRLRLIVGPDYVGAADAARYLQGVDRLPVVAHPVLVREYPDEMMVARQMLDRILRDAAANDDARARFEDLALINTVSNLPALAAGADARSLFGRFSQTPAIVVGAGPSLDENLAAIREVQDRALVIAADTALLPCLKAGVVPPLVIALDPSEFNGRHLVACAAATETHLVTEASVDPAGLEAFAGRTFLFRVGDHAPWPWLHAAGVDRARLAVWGSVATAALDLALQAGCPAVAFAGLDLAYTADRPYCRNTIFEERWARAVVDGHSLDEQWELALTHRQSVDEPDVNGRTTQSSPHLLAFRDWIREVTAAHPAVRFVNATGAGVLHGPRIAQQPLAVFAREHPVAGRIAFSAIVGDAYLASIDGTLGARLATQLANATGPAIARGHSDAPRASSAHLSTAWLSAIAPTLTAATPSSSAAPMTAAFSQRRIPLPEQTSLLAALADGTLDPPAAPDRDGAAARLREALDRLGCLVERAHGVPSPLAAHDLLATWSRVPARLLFDWPPALAGDVDAFGSILAEAIRLAGPPDGRSTVGRLAADDVVQGERAVDRTLPHTDQANATLASATLVWQWTLVCALTLGGDSWLTRSTLRLLFSPPAPVPTRQPAARMRAWVGGATGAGARLPFLSGLSTMRAISGLVAADSDGAAIAGSALPALHLSLSGRDDDALMLIEAVEPESLLARGYPRAHLVYPLPDDRVLVGQSDGSGIAVMSASGELVGIEAWPMPVRASISLGRSERLAWHFPNAPRLLHRDLATDRVEVIDLPVGVFDALARPDGSVCLATDAGLWTWTPGKVPQRLVLGPWIVSLHAYGDAVRACARPARDAAGCWDATTELLEWQPGAVSFRAVPVAAGSAPFSVAEHAGWRAEAWLDGCVVRLVRNDGHVFWLACTGPRSLAWAGTSLYVATASGEVLRFPDIATRLAAR